MDAEERPERVVENSVPSFKRPGHSNDFAPLAPQALETGDFGIVEPIL